MEVIFLAFSFLLKSVSKHFQIVFANPLAMGHMSKMLILVTLWCVCGRDNGYVYVYVYKYTHTQTTK